MRRKESLRCQSLAGGTSRVSPSEPLEAPLPTHVRDGHVDGPKAFGVALAVVALEVVLDGGDQRRWDHVRRLCINAGVHLGTTFGDRHRWVELPCGPDLLQQRLELTKHRHRGVPSVVRHPAPRIQFSHSIIRVTQGMQKGR